MDKRIKELAEQAGLMCTEDVNADGAAGILLWFKKFDLERFAQLVRADEREAQVCCGDYEKCMKACTPRGRWLANKQITRFEQEKKQFVGGIPEVSQQREWVGLTLNDITGHMCDCADDDGTYKTSCFIDYAKAIEQKLKDLNT